MRKPCAIVVVSLVAFSATGARVEAVDDEKLGAFLAGTCTSCHQAEVAASAIPGITGWDEAKFVATMDAFRSGERTEPIMRAIVSSLNDAEIGALAHYLAEQER
jgi:cytochrome c553